MPQARIACPGSEHGANVQGGYATLRPRPHRVRQRPGGTPPQTADGPALLCLGFELGYFPVGEGTKFSRKDVEL